MEAVDNGAFLADLTKRMGTWQLVDTSVDCCITACNHV